MSQQYLGTAEEVTGEVVADAEPGSRSAASTSGSGIWRQCGRRWIDWAWSAIIDEVAPRHANAAASVGTYLALAARTGSSTRVPSVRSPTGGTTTAGARCMKIRAGARGPPPVLGRDGRLGEPSCERSRPGSGARWWASSGWTLTGLALDMTNFATFIDTGNEKAPIAQRGKAKQKRADLRLVGLGLVVTRDGGIPVICHAYPGDRPDVTQFATVIDQLVARYRDLVSSVESLTVVYDAGQNSGDNHHVVEQHGIGFVGSLPPSDHPDLLDIAERSYRPVDPERYPGLRYVDTTVTALGVTRRAVLTHSANLAAKQSRGLDQTLAKARRRLTELQARLARGRTRRPREQVEAEIAAILKPRWVADILTVTLTGDEPAQLRLHWHTDSRARKRLEQRIFGKRILFTNRDWPVPDIVAAYRSQSDAEFGFRQLKDPHVVSFSPMHHWTDHKIRVHVFYCVLALAVAHLMRRQANHAGLHLSVRELLDQLAAHRRNRAALPRRRQGTPPRATHAHRHDPHPTETGRPVRH